MKVLFTGGGTMGSVSPLLAIKEELAKDEGFECLWVGTKDGPEKSIVEQNEIPFKSIPYGKIRRYFDWKNFTDPFLILGGFFKSLWIIFRYKPDIILTAGSFVSPPVVWAGALLKKRTVLHQSDIIVGLANKTMKPFVTKITVAFDVLRDKFPKEKVVITGNPVRESVLAGDKDRAQQFFKLEKDLPTVLIMGGGVGSEVVNGTFVDAAKKLTEFCQVIHLVGKGAQSKWVTHPDVSSLSRYHAYEFLSSEMADAYAAADIVISRGGSSSLTEFAALKKAAIIIPIPDNQQEANVQYFNEKKAIVYVRQEDMESGYMVGLIKDLIEKPQKLQELRENIANSMPQNATQDYVHLVKEMVKIVDI